ncbi:MAG TPA: hypothetical protein VIN60_08815, partial [Anaerolineales bacterium]
GLGCFRKPTLPEKPCFFSLSLAKVLSITPLFVKPNNSQEVALFPVLIDSSQISAPVTEGFYSLRAIFVAGKEEGVTMQGHLTVMSKLDSGDTTDGLVGTATLKYIGAGVDPNAEAERTAILNDPRFDRSAEIIWPPAVFDTQVQ